MTDVFSPERKIFWFSVYSRLLMILLSAISNFLIPDHNADAFRMPQDPNNEIQTTADVIVEYLFGGLVRWDAQYFIHIAQYGYTYENCLAFFPLYPLAIRTAAESLHYIFQGVISRYYVFIVSAVIINFFVFILSASVLYRLSLQVLRNTQWAYKACILYCVNPANIFFVAPYSETVYACLTFYGMMKCGTGSIFSSSLGCGLPFGLAAIQRSNGILNVGFIFHERLKYFLRHVMPDVITKAKHLTSWFLAPVLLIPPVISIISLLGEILLCITPFVMFQGYGYYKFCIVPNHNLPDFIISYAEDNYLRIPGTSSALAKMEDHWCNRSIPLAYSYIQEHYWNVGFLRYYEWKQVPNFLLAFPVVWFILSHSYKYARENRQLCFSLGLWDYSTNENDPKIEEKLRSQIKQNKIKMPSGTFVFIVHIVFLTIFCALCINVQVTTRMVASSSPVLYWFAAAYFIEPLPFIEQKHENKNTVHFANRLRKIKEVKKQGNTSEMQVDSIENLESRWKVFLFSNSNLKYEARLIKYYFLSYIFLGTLLFSNFLPWT